MRRLFYLLIVFSLLVTACGGGTNDAESTTTAVGVTTSDSEAADVTTTTVAAAGGSETTASSAPTTIPETPPETPTTTTTAPPTGSDEGFAPLVAAIARTGEFTSARLEGWLTMVGANGLPSGSEETMTFQGAYDTTVPSSMMLMDFSAMTASMPGSEDLSPEMGDLIGEMEIRTIGSTAFFRMGLFAMFGIATPWISAPAEEADDIASGFGTNTADPTDTLALFAFANGDVDQVGQEQVRGVNTTHYRLTADVEAMLALADPEAAEELRNTTGFPKEGSVPFDIWIGDDGFVRRYSYAVDGTTDPDSGFESMELVWEIFDYGSPVDITAPPASEVTDGGALIALATG